MGRKYYVFRKLDSTITCILRADQFPCCDYPSAGFEAVLLTLNRDRLTHSSVAPYYEFP